MARCLLTGVPRINFRPLPFEIVQLPDRVIMLYEIHHAFRIIPTDGRPPPEDAEPSYLGESVARWDGDTLVVDVTSFNDKTWLTGVGTIHTEDLRVTERYTRDSFDTIRYEVTMEDPAVFTRPWTLRETFRLRPGERIREYECIESNEDLAALRALAASSRPLLKKLREPLGRRQLGKLRPRVARSRTTAPSIPRKGARPVAAGAACRSRRPAAWRRASPPPRSARGCRSPRRTPLRIAAGPAARSGGLAPRLGPNEMRQSRTSSVLLNAARSAAAAQRAVTVHEAARRRCRRKRDGAAEAAAADGGRSIVRARRLD